MELLQFKKVKHLFLSFIISSFVIWPGLARAQTQIKILVIGDSISLGSYPTIIQNSLPGSQIIKFAQVGKSSGYMLGEVQTSIAGLEAEKPTHVFILLGANDAPTPNLNAESVKTNINNIIFTLRNTGAAFYISQIPPQKNNVQNVLNINAQIASMPGAVLQEDLTADILLPDGVHLNETGHQIIACNFLQTSGLKTDCVKPKIAPKANVPAKIPTRGKKCPTGESLGFASLRPDPGEPCEEFVPVDTQFACGSSITPSEQESFDPYGDGCDKNTDGTVTCYRVENFDVSIDLAKANLGILGNTQDQNLTDEQKVNEYLSWYLSGVTDKKLVDFAGPIRKLLPYDLSYSAKETIINENSKTVHNYKVGEMGFGLIRANLSDFAGIFSINRELFKSLFQNIPFSSLEDTVGEYVVSATDLKRNNLQDPDVLSPGDKGFQVPVKLTITNTSKAP